MNIDLLGSLVSLLTFFGISAIIALSLNIEYGVAGIPNFGQALFVSLGAYTAGVTYTRLMPLLAGREALEPCGATNMAAALALNSSERVLTLDFRACIACPLAFPGILVHGCHPRESGDPDGSIRRRPLDPRFRGDDSRLTSSLPSIRGR